jgi:hypothetical protein
MESCKRKDVRQRLVKKGTSVDGAHPKLSGEAASCISRTGEGLHFSRSRLSAQVMQLPGRPGHP